jgi:hypothetical protein
MAKAKTKTKAKAKEVELKKFTRGFTEAVYGYHEVMAEDAEDAQKKFDDGDYDQFDNKSDYEMDDEWQEG